MIEKRILMIDNTSKMNSLKNKNVDEKISILKETIYPKKNKKISNSLKILPSSKKYIKGSLKQINNDKLSSQLRKSESQKVVYQKNASFNPKKTTIQFFPNKNKISNEPNKVQTMDSWYPSKSSSYLKIRISTSNKVDRYVEEKQLCPKQQYKPRAFPVVKDPQSLLRKNSLFLLNFIRMREKNSQKGPHIGQIPIKYQDSEELRREKFQERQVVKQKEKAIEYPSHQTNRIYREKQYMETLKSKKQLKIEKKDDSFVSPIYPQPW